MSFKKMKQNSTAFKVVASSELIKHTDLRSLGLFKVTQTLCGYHVMSSGFTLIISIIQSLHSVAKVSYDMIDSFKSFIIIYTVKWSLMPHNEIVTLFIGKSLFKKKKKKFTSRHRW